MLLLTEHGECLRGAEILAVAEGAPGVAGQPWRGLLVKVVHFGQVLGAHAVAGPLDMHGDAHFLHGWVVGLILIIYN